MSNTTPRWKSDAELNTAQLEAKEQGKEKVLRWQGLTPFSTFGSIIQT
jgi:hypothetical protein